MSAEHLCARDFTVVRRRSFHHNELTALAQDQEVATGSNECAATDVLSPLDLSASKVKTTQLSSSDVAIYAVDVPLHEHGAGELAPQILVAPNLCYLPGANLH